MKPIAVVAFFALVACSFAVEFQAKSITVAPELDLCPTCVSFTTQALDELINIVVNAGIVGSCSAVCSELPNKIESTVCNLLCDYIGISEFVKILRRADLDPIYFCELVKVCPVYDNGNATVDSATVSPTSGRQGQTFTFEMDFTVYNQTGTGQYAISILPPDGEPFGDAELTEGFAPGKYAVRFQLQAKPSEQEPFSPGVYKVELAYCEGECGSKHPHSQIYGVQTTEFTITA